MIAALRHRSFRALWLSQSISVLGDRIVQIALAIYVTQDLGGPADLGAVMAAYTVPLVLFLLVGGVWADRLDRKRVVLLTDLTRGILHALLAVLILTRSIEVWQLVVIGVLFGSAEAFFRPAYTGLMPRTVPDELVQEARALSGLSDNVATLAGPLAATALVVGLGGGIAFAIDAGTFLISAALMTRVRARPGGTVEVRGSVREEFAEGFAHVRTRPWVWITILVASFVLLAGVAPFFVLGPTVARERYGEIAVFGIVQAVFGAGAIAGAMAGSRWRPARPMVAGHLCLFGMPASWIALAAGAPQPVLYLVTALGGAGFSLFLVWWETALAQHIPPDALSRVSSFDWMGSLALLPLGYVLAGPIGDAYGADDVLLAGGLISFAVTAAGLASRGVRQLRAYEPAAAG